MSYVKELLACNEQIVRVARDHWITLLPTILIDVAVSVVIIGLSVLGIILSPPWTWLGLLILVAPIGHLALRLGTWWNKQHIITNRRVIQVSGAFEKRVSDTLLEKVNDVVMEQSALGRMFRFGDIQIISGSECGIDAFHRLADPVTFKKELFNQKEALDNLDAFEAQAGRVLSSEPPSAGDIPELIAKLNELCQKGVISKAEFEEKKRQLLDKI